MLPFFDARKQWAEIGPDALKAADRVGRAGQWVLGQEVERFEAALSEITSLPHVVACASGLDALEMALRCAGLSSGDRVLTTPLSAFATTLAIVKAGGVPVFIDVDSCGLLDLDLAREILKSDPGIRYLLPVHLYGFPLDASKLRRLASDFGVTIVEDCAQALGAAFQSTPAGSSGKAMALSFYPTKNLGALGDGGALATSDATLAAQARRMRDYGQSAKYVHAAFGMNSRFDELQAGIMNGATLPRLDAWVKRRLAVDASYRSRIKNSAVKPLTGPDPVGSSRHIFPVLVKGGRDLFRRHLERAGVQTAEHYPRVIPQQPYLLEKGGFEAKTSLRYAEQISAAEVSLPLHPWLGDEDVTRVIDAVNSWRP